MEKRLNTPLTTNEIDFRIQSISVKGYATILAYKDARVDMQRLDDVFGVGFWQRKHQLINGNLFCSVGIWNKELQQWVWVEDVGTESFTEKEKGQASDSFKRACFNLGIGRELYEYPFIMVELNKDEFEIKENQGKKMAKQTYNLKLKEWKWHSEFVDGKLMRLACKDNKGQKRFDWKHENYNKQS